MNFHLKPNSEPNLKENLKKIEIFFKIILGKTAQNAVFLVNTSVLLFERNGWALIEIGLKWSKIQANIMNFHLKPPFRV